MRKADFARKCPGKLIPTEFTEYPNGPMEPKKTKTFAYCPNPLPPDLDWQQILLEQFENYTGTVSVLGKLNGLHKRVGNAAGLLRTLWMREAKLSSQIEDLDTTAEDMVLAGAGRKVGIRQDSQESWNYVRALEYGVSSNLPWSGRVIRDMHRLLLSNVRGKEKRPGEFRIGGAYIGDRSRGVRHARFVPMPGGNPIKDAISDLEKFVNAEHSEIPPLFVIALTHYQFETLHPFSDGNGRIGRVLISRSLVKEGLLEHPVVYMSAYIKDHKQEYVDLMLGISQRGGEYWGRWIEFLLNAIRTQAKDAIWRSEMLIELRETYHKRLVEAQTPARLFEVIDHLFSLPAINVAGMIKLTGVSKPTAKADLLKLEELKVLHEYTGKSRDQDWLAHEIINVIEQEQPAT